jgi:hypothetical protein
MADRASMVDRARHREVMEAVADTEDSRDTRATVVVDMAGSREAAIRHESN